MRHKILGVLAKPVEKWAPLCGGCGGSFAPEVRGTHVSKSARRGAPCPSLVTEVVRKFRLSRFGKELVNRQKLHDWAYLAVSKPKIILANLSDSPIALCYT